MRQKRRLGLGRKGDRLQITDRVFSFFLISFPIENRNGRRLRVADSPPAETKKIRERDRPCIKIIFGQIFRRDFQISISKILHKFLFDKFGCWIFVSFWSLDLRESTSSNMDSDEDMVSKHAPRRSFLQLCSAYCSIFYPLYSLYKL